FKNRGALLVPVALVLVVFGRPSFESAIIGVSIALAGEALRIWAVGYSGVTTRADVVTAPALVTNGPYAFVRNPLYLANAIIALGFWAAFSGGVSPASALLMLVATVAFVGGVYAVIVPLEETYLAGHFGEPYRRYMSAVPRLLPTGASFPKDERAGTWRAVVIGRAEIITLAFLAVMILMVYLKLGPLSTWGLYFGGAVDL
ncbi:MAG TPA: isoprenylcysteine carboxylmethyltransferase family protein, partial [Candidatus Eremiobacteraceae bacterium]|nr:isoprenylcysteine carboxylmethyltransferase family protein [Candidatus Eremiobacteraceae bacterium]